MMQHLNAGRLVTMAAAGLALMGGVALADPDPTAELVIEGELHLTTRAPSNPAITPNLPTLYSGWLFRDPTTREMQMDDFENPGLLAVEAGAAAWATPEGTGGQSCADCHGDPESMEGLRAVLPRVNEHGQLWSMENYINNCRTERMGAEALGWNSREMREMTALISFQSRGMPVNVAIDGPAAPFWEQGREMYYTRFGQLEMSCATCHEESAGQYIRSDHLSQGQINGFPTYRLKDQAIVGIHGRFVGCIRDTRAETFRAGSDEFRALELYVASRGNGLSVEGVSVRH